ncbi:MAG: hypothetical protein PHC54_02105 [Candidatus Omnitrophica bacterium]|nr:hypothetical protein [Candidatus Omnitrophota bacterium]MDD5592087.1 hypothetical protein [Candidatus Omnitrophota bacterium]
MRKIKYKLIKAFLIFIFAYSLQLTAYSLFAQDADKTAALMQQIIEVKTNTDLYAPFEELKNLYFQENKYSEFIESLGPLLTKKEASAPFVNYYTALSRYSQLKYLEETQNWDEYFNKGNTYRDELNLGLQNTIASTNAKEALNLYAKLLLWQFHKDQQDVFADAAFTDLLNTASEYAKDTQNPKPIKDVADKLLAYAEKNESRQLYRLYVEKLIASVKEDKELENIALGFYQEGNLELSEALFDAYIERISKESPKDRVLLALIDIARKFSYREDGTKDAAYAEKIFAKIEEIGKKDAFSEELKYLRAFNAQTLKEYAKAKDFYLDLLQRYPKSAYADEANLKAGIISTYILRDIKAGRDYFSILVQKEPLAPGGILSLYQLGLLSQWENDLEKAKGYYRQLLEKAGENFPETTALARERLKEIEEAKPLEYNLKTFLDLSLKDEYKIFDMTKLDLKASLAKARKGQGINFSTSTYAGESGCMQVEIQYLWSGELGATQPATQEQAFDTAYNQAGTKIISLVVASPSGIIDRGIVILDID